MRTKQGLYKLGAVVGGFGLVLGVVQYAGNRPFGGAAAGLLLVGVLSLLIGFFWPVKAG